MYNMLSFHRDRSKKIVILGLAESGKSTMINGVIKGIRPQPGDKYDATINYQRFNQKFCNTELSIFDLGGQTRFLDQFTGDLAEFVFSDLERGAFIFVIEPLKVAEFSRARYYFELSLQKLDYYSSNSLIYIFLNKIDLLPRKYTENTSTLIRDYLISELTREIRFYETSVYNESIFLAIGDVLAEITGIRDSLTDILQEFIQQNESIIDQVQVLTKEGAILLVVKNNKNLLNLSLKETKNIFDLSYLHITQEKITDKVVLIEPDRTKLSITNFMNNGLAVMVLVSKDGLKENTQLSASIYDQILSLSNQIELFMQ